MLRSACSSQLRRQLTGAQRVFGSKMGFATASKIKDVNTEVEWERLLKDAEDTKQPIVAEFTAQWCPPCRMIHPVLEDLAEKNPQVSFIKLNIDLPDLLPVVTRHNVSAVPTFVSYQGRTQVTTFSGADREKLADMVQQVAP